ncbi:hypothetical protein ElyMa_003421900 [Elysia marginata]|uniref:Uncharacterized protein n=1 Tax=Elysia marginata TaxID=1093978 RepID=A0AAV4JRT0_9GAST|nr:hypothetical protein ElyMa_003421900 [Elysia marginata]
MTALHLACRLGHEEMVQILLDSGANCAIRDKIKKWPDHYTTNRTILTTFDKHFVVCTHGRRKVHGATSNDDTTSSLHTVSLLESTLTLLDKSSSQKAPSTNSRNLGVTRDAAGVAVIDDDAEMERLRVQGRDKRDREGLEHGHIEHREVEIFDEGAQYDSDRDALAAGAIKRNDKKWKINHKMDFSDQHKQRMQQNVFDRLLHASKKKNQNA